MNEWRKSLRELLEEAETKRAAREAANRDAQKWKRVKHFISDTVVPAFEQVAEELQDHDRDVELEHARDFATITVYRDGEREFYFGVRARAYKEREFAFPALPLRDAQGRIYRAEAFTDDGPLKHDVTDYTTEEIIELLLYEYRRHLRWST